MIQLEILAILVAIFLCFTFFNLYLLLHLLNRSRDARIRTQDLKNRWFRGLPGKLAELGKNISNGTLTEEDSPDKILDIVIPYHMIDDIEISYSGRQNEEISLIRRLAKNFLALLVGAIFIALAVFQTDNENMILISLAGGVFLAIFLNNIYVTIKCLISEEDDFREIEEALR